MNVLIVGSGGREHALTWKIRQSSLVDRVFVAPGNAGTEIDAENVPIAVDDFPSLVEFAKTNSIDLTVVGPEAPLCDGIVDIFVSEGLKAFGPSKAAAQLEGSKVFCKNMLRTAGVPAAEDHIFRDPNEAERFVNERFAEDGDNIQLVVKADGLAAGKGAIVCHTRTEIFEAIDRVARQKEFGKAGDQIILEEMLVGQECSVLAITDGRTIVTLPPAQDHKRAFDNDLGPNTGGMGAYSPAPIVSDKLLTGIEADVFVPTVHAMNRSRCRFKGVLYAGMMLTGQGPKVLEYNVRFGDPECQPLLMRMKSDLFELMLATVDGRLNELDPLEWDTRPSVCVVMANEGYPGNYSKGNPIRGLNDANNIEDVKVFHAGTANREGKIVATGGRVLGVTAIADSIPAAKLKAYQAVKCIRWDGAWCRKDIADKAFDFQQTEFANSTDG